MAGKAAALLVVLALVGATPSVGGAKGPPVGGGSGTAPPAAVPSGGQPSQPSARNVQPRSGGSTAFGGESDLAGLILYALVAIVVLVVIPTQIAKGVTARRRGLSRSARSGGRNRPNGA
jgi:hypothetical protein